MYVTIHAHIKFIILFYSAAVNMLCNSLASVLSDEAFLIPTIEAKNYLQAAQ